MGYKNATAVLPSELLEAIQQHIDGDYLYIPRREENKLGWGEKKNSKEPIRVRNQTIARQYRDGSSVKELAERYYLSPKTIYKIVSM